MRTLRLPAVRCSIAPMRNAIFISIVTLVASGCSDKEAPQACVPVLPGWTTPQTGKPVSVIANTVTLSDREIRWNGVAIDGPTLAEYARQSAAMSPIPFLIFDPEEASDCSFATEVRDVLDPHFPCREGGCLQGTEAAFKRAPYRKPTGSAVP